MKSVAYEDVYRDDHCDSRSKSSYTCADRSLQSVHFIRQVVAEHNSVSLTIV